MKNPRRVTSELLQLGQAWVRPQHELVFRKAVARHELLLVRAPEETAHLAPSINAVKQSTRVGIPKFDGPVRRSTPRREQRPLKGGPSKGLHSSFVLAQDEPWCGLGRLGIAAAHGEVPEAEVVLVAP